MSSAYLRGVTWAEQTLTPLAERIIATIEDPPEQPLAPKTPARDLESELLQGGHSTLRSCAGSATRTPASSSAPAEFVTKAEAQQLRADCDALLQQRERLRAQLIVEQERRERAEAELVAVGAQWLGTETQDALRQRAELEKKRELQLARTAIQREADQRVAKLEAERTMLLEKLGEKAPSAAQLRMQLRAALQQELEQAQREAREAVRAHLNASYEERSRLRTALSTAEAMHRLEVEALRASLRKASELMQEQYDKGFVMGLKEAASALAPTTASATSVARVEHAPTTAPATSAAREEHAAAAAPSAPTTAPVMTLTIALVGCINGVGVGLDASNLVNMLAEGSPAAASELRMGDKVILWNGVAMVDPVCGRQRKLKEVVVRSDTHTLVVERAGAAAQSDTASASQGGMAAAAAVDKAEGGMAAAAAVDKAEYRRMKEALVERLEAERAEKARQAQKARQAVKAMEDDESAGKALEDERVADLGDDLGGKALEDERVADLGDDLGGKALEDERVADLGDDLGGKALEDERAAVCDEKRACQGAHIAMPPPPPPPPPQGEPPPGEVRAVPGEHRRSERAEARSSSSSSSSCLAKGMVAPPEVDGAGELDLGDEASELAEEDEELDLGDNLCPIHQGEAEAEAAPPPVPTAPPQGALLTGLKVRAAGAAPQSSTVS
jgi:hypothetical protein